MSKAARPLSPGNSDCRPKKMLFTEQAAQAARERLRAIFRKTGPTAVEDAELRERAMLDQLIAATRLYDTSNSVQALLNFTVRLRGFAPFNAMLLHVQKPGLTYAATAKDWWARFGRAPKRGARPLLILRVMGPVDFVFDFLDTEGEPLPDAAFSFPTFGNMSEMQFAKLLASVRRDGIEIVDVDAGDALAGWIHRIERSPKSNSRQRYQLGLNLNHTFSTRFVTLAHELGHLHLGHLGADKARRVPDRTNRSHALREVEAEMTAWLVAKRNGLTPRSESYLSSFKGAFDELDLYSVMRAANAVETTIGISAQKFWNEKV
jgi:hypothetical protein